MKSQYFQKEEEFGCVRDNSYHYKVEWNLADKINEKASFVDISQRYLLKIFDRSRLSIWRIICQKVPRHRQVKVDFEKCQNIVNQAWLITIDRQE